MYKVLKKCGRAKRAEFHTPHGVIQTPVFMNVGTAGAIKGAVSTEDLEQLKCQVELSNTYHLHLRPDIRAFRRQPDTFIKRHRNRGAKVGLNLHTFLRPHKNLSAINMRAEINALLLDFAQKSKGEYLKAAGN